MDIKVTIPNSSPSTYNGLSTFSVTEANGEKRIVFSTPGQDYNFAIPNQSTVDILD